MLIFSGGGVEKLGKIPYIGWWQISRFGKKGVKKHKKKSYLYKDK